MPERLTFTETVSSAKAMRAFASSFAKRLAPPFVLTLEGPLGAGKTTFTQGFVDGLVRASDAPVLVQSPTYALMRTYATTPPVHHLDLYRLHETGGDAAVMDQLEALGILDALTASDAGFALVEWPGTARWPIAVGAVRITPISARRRVVDVDLPAAVVRA